MRVKPEICVVAALVTLLPLVGHGYSMRIHEELTRRSLAPDAWLLSPKSVSGASVADLTRFRRWLYDRILALPDQALRQRFLARYPSPDAFDAVGLRTLLGFNRRASQRIWSIDRAKPGRGLLAVELLAESSSAPDSDFRNRNRIEYDPSGQAVQDVHGRYIPDDPAILNMGKVVGLSSQAHAHYGLPEVEFSDDPDVLQAEPWRFAVAAGYPEGPILTLAADMAQLHTDLAMLAAAWAQPASRYLTVTFAGQSFHYLEDVGNQIHTVQVGLYDFFVDAKIQYWWRAFVSSGGYLAELRKFTSIGIDILRNHHIFIEDLTKARFLEALAGEASPAARALLDFAEDDPDMVERLDKALAALDDGTRFAEAITRALIEASAREGGEAYGLARQVACGRLRSYGFEVPDDTTTRAIPPDQLLCLDGDDDEAALNALYALQAKAFRRVATALRRYDRELAATLKGAGGEAVVGAVLARFLTARLDALDAAEARRTAWLAAPPDGAGDAVKEPAWAIAQAAVALLLFGGWWWWLRRRFPLERPPET